MRRELSGTGNQQEKFGELHIDNITMKKLEEKDMFMLQKEDKVIVRSEIIFENEKIRRGI